MGKTLFVHGFKPHFLTSLCWVSLCSCIFHGCGFIFKRILSSWEENSGATGSDFAGICKKSEKGIDKSENQEMDSDQSERTAIPESDDEVKSVSNAGTSKYQFYSGNNSLCSVIEEPKTMSFSVQEMFAISGSSGNTDFCELNGEEECVKQGKTERSIFGLSFVEQEALIFTHLYFCEKGVTETEDVEYRGLSEHNLSDDFWAVIHEVDDFSGNSGSDSDSDEVMCDRSTDKGLASESPAGIADEMVDFHGDSPESLNDLPFDQKTSHSSTSNTEEDTPTDEVSTSDDELVGGSSTFEDFNGVYAKEVCDGEEAQNEPDFLLEQKELIRQMKKEIRHSKSGGLPIILEESESPRVEDDLRPLKIDDKIGYKDCMDEIQSIYKGYLDKMRKLDILSQQTMYAIGLLQLKNQDLYAWNKKISVPIIKFLSAQNFWSYKTRKHEEDPVQKMIKDLQRDLEYVYVGQICLSWEILKWQCHKAEELQSYDYDGFHQHNQAATEFLQFQVLLQRFTEDEPYHHGPRVQHYFKNRCDIPNLLQVPLMKDDPRNEWKGHGEGGISIAMLKDVIKATMCAFWEFLCADKDEITAWTQSGNHGVEFDLQDPSDTELLAEIRSNLQKKEKRLKDLGRSGNRIVKKFKKHQDQRLSREMLLAQVELRLISRVLHMPKLTADHLLWCHKKLSRINVIGRKVYVESSFLLFPT